MADVEGWVTRGLENVEVAIGQTTSAPDIRLSLGGHIRVQLVNAETDKPMRLEKPTKGFVYPFAQPRRAAIFSSQNNRVELKWPG